MEHTNDDLWFREEIKHMEENISHIFLHLLLMQKFLNSL